jgi:hypothetical protein
LVAVVSTGCVAHRGTTKNRGPIRLAVGVGGRRSGANLLYVGGANLDLATLADALAQVGAIRGMQLDTHNEMVDFLSYPAGAAHAFVGVTVFPDMAGSSDRYLVPDQRDFFVVTLR